MMARRPASCCSSPSRHSAAGATRGFAGPPEDARGAAVPAGRPEWPGDEAIRRPAVTQSVNSKFERIGSALHRPLQPRSLGVLVLRGIRSLGLTGTLGCIVEDRLVVGVDGHVVFAELGPSPGFSVWSLYLPFGSSWPVAFRRPARWRRRSPSLWDGLALVGHRARDGPSPAPSPASQRGQRQGDGEREEAGPAALGPAWGSDRFTVRISARRRGTGAVTRCRSDDGPRPISMAPTQYESEEMTSPIPRVLRAW